MSDTRIQITAGGIYGGDGKEVPVGTELTVKGELTGWAGRYQVLSSGGEGKTAITNPEGGEAGGYTVQDGGNGWWSILDANGQKVGKGLREDDAKAFESLSDEDKAAFATEHAKA